MTGKKSTITAAVFFLLVALPAMMASYAGQSQRSQEAPAEKPQAPAPSQTLKVDVELVLVTATVTDSLNRFVSGLEQEHFQLWEDKVQQKVATFSSEDVPISVGVILDVSGSMKDKIATAVDAAGTFLKSGSPDDEYFLSVFSNKPQVISDFTTDITKLQSKLLFTQAKGMTAMYDAVYLGLERLKEGGNPKKALLLITDGEDNQSRYTFSQVRDFVKEQDVQIYAIGIVDDWSSQLSSGRTGRALVEELSAITGGQAFFPNSVYELEDITTKIAIELKNQYVIGYHSTNKADDGKWRKLRMTINPPKSIQNLHVRYKTGYYAPLADAKAAGKK